MFIVLKISRPQQTKNLQYSSLQTYMQIILQPLTASIKNEAYLLPMII